MSADPMRGPRQWETLLADSTKEARSLVYEACADCRERHVGWCPEQLFDSQVCPLREPAVWARLSQILH